MKLEISEIYRKMMYMVLYSLKIGLLNPEAVLSLQ